MQSYQSKKVIKLFGISLCVFILFLSFNSALFGNIPFVTRGEAREALVTTAMIEKHDMIMPLTKAHEISYKPPTLHWLGVFSSKFFGGHSERAIRFPSVFLGALALALLFLVFHHLSDIKTALLSVFILGTSLEWLRSAGHARVDMCLAFFVTLTLFALYFLIRTWKSGIREYWYWLILSIIASFFAVMSKGPIGIALPISVAGLYFIFIQDRQRFKKTLSFIIAPGLFFTLITVTLSGIWYYFAYLERGDLFVQVHLLSENVARFTNVPGAHPGHRHPFYYSILYLIVSYLPWSFYFPLLFAFLWKKRKEIVSKQESGILFSLVWLVIVFILCTVSSSKRSVYFLPAFPPLAYLTGYAITHYATDLASKHFTKKIITWSMCFFTTLLVIVFVITGVVVLSDSFSSFVYSFAYGDKDLLQIKLVRDILQLSPEFYLFLLIPISTAIVSCLYLRKKNIYQSAVLLVVTMLTIVPVVGIIFLPKYVVAMSPQPLIEHFEQHLPVNAPVYQYRNTLYAYSYYNKRDIPLVSDLSSILSSNYYVFVSQGDLKRALSEKPNSQIVSEGDIHGRGKIYLLLIHSY